MVDNRYKMRYMTTRDHNEVCDLDHTIYDVDAMEPDELKQVMSGETMKAGQGKVGYVITDKHVIVAYIIYFLEEDRIFVHRLVVDPAYTQEGLGTQLITFVRARMNDNRRKLQIYAADNNLVAHLFLKKEGFKAILIERDMYTNKDGYFFQYVAP